MTPEKKRTPAIPTNTDELMVELEKIVDNCSDVLDKDFLEGYLGAIRDIRQGREQIRWREKKGKDKALEDTG